MWHLEITKLNGRQASTTKPQDGYLPNETNIKTTWKCWGQMMQSWKKQTWVTIQTWGVLGSRDLIKEHLHQKSQKWQDWKYLHPIKKQHTLKWWLSLWKWIHYDRTDGLRLLTSFILLRTWTLIIWSIFTFDWPCMINITSKVGTVLHSNSEIGVSHFLDEMRNVWFNEADIESETRNND